MHLSLSNDVSSFMLIRSENLQGRSTMPLHPMEGQGSPPPTPNMAAAEGINSDILSERHSRCPFLCNLRRKFQISSHKSQMWDLQWLIPYMGPGEPPQPPLLSNMAAMGGINSEILSGRHVRCRFITLGPYTFSDPRNRPELRKHITSKGNYELDLSTFFTLKCPLFQYSPT